MHIGVKTEIPNFCAWAPIGQTVPQAQTHRCDAALALEQGVQGMGVPRSRFPRPPNPNPL